MTKTNKQRNWVVVVETDAQGPVYLGNGYGQETDASKVKEADRSGVRRVDYALRFTERGAKRVVKGWSSAVVAGRAYVKEIAS